MADENWLEKLDAATAGGSTALGDVRLSALEEHMERERAPLAPVHLHDRHRQPSEPEHAPEPDAISDRFARLEALLLDLAHRVDRFAGEAAAAAAAAAVSPPAPPVEELQMIEVGIRAAARVMLRSSDELSAAVASTTDASNPTTDAVRRLAAAVEGLEQRLQSVEHRLEHIAEADAAIKSQLAEALRRLEA